MTRAELIQFLRRHQLAVPAWIRWSDFTRDSPRIVERAAERLT